MRTNPHKGSTRLSAAIRLSKPKRWQIVMSLTAVIVMVFVGEPPGTAYGDDDPVVSSREDPTPDGGTEFLYVYASGKQVVVVKDANGQLVSVGTIDQFGKLQSVEQYFYDDQGRLKEKDTYEGYYPNGNAIVKLVSSYDERGCEKTAEYNFYNEEGIRGETETYYFSKETGNDCGHLNTVTTVLYDDQGHVESSYTVDGTPRRVLRHSEASDRNLQAAGVTPQGRPKLPGVPNQPPGALGAIDLGGAPRSVFRGSGLTTGATPGVAGNSSDQVAAANQRKIIWQKASSAATNTLTGGNSATGGTAGVAGPSTGTASGGTAVLGPVGYTYSDEGRTETGTVTDGNGNLEFQMTTTKDPNGQISWFWVTGKDGGTYVGQVDSSGGMWALTKTGPGGAAKRSDAHVDQDVVDSQGVGQGRPKLPGVPNQPNADTNTALTLHPGQSIKGLKRTQGAPGSTGTGGGTAEVAEPSMGSATGGTAGIGGTHGPGGQAGAGNKRKIIWQKPSSAATNTGSSSSGGNSAVGATAGVAGASTDTATGGTAGVADTSRGEPPREPTPKPTPSNQKKKWIKRKVTNVGSSSSEGNSAVGATAGVAGSSSGQAGAGNKRKIIWQKSSSAATKTGSSSSGGNSAVGATAGVAGPGTGTATGGTAGVANTSRGEPQRQPTPKPTPSNRKKKDSYSTHRAEDG
jgi:hypothetical protein